MISSRAALGVVLAGACAWALVSSGCAGAAPDDGTAATLPMFQGSNNPLEPGGGGSQAAGQTAAQCTPNGARCRDATTLETCNAQGTAFAAAACGAGQSCVAGICLQLNCTAGETLCLGGDIHTCNPDGRSTTLAAACGAGQSCNPTTEQCQQLLCDPLVAACNGNVATRCDGTGFAFDSSSVGIACGAMTCMSGVCRNPELNNPGENPLNPPVTPVDPNNPVNPIDPQNPVASACTANEVTCAGANLIGTCSADGSNLAVTPCPDGTVCEGAGTCTPVACNAQAMTSFNGGEATVYWFGQGTVNFGDIACGYGIDPGDLNNGNGDAVDGIQDPTRFVAINTANYRGSASCGACVEMNYQGRTVVATVVDECPIGSNPTCTAGHLDLSRGAWNALTNNAAGTQIFGVNWRFVPCTADENMTIRLKEPNNEYWNEFVVENHRYPIAQAQVLMEDGRWVDAQRGQYNFWRPPEGGEDGGDMGTYRVRITDINGGIIERQLELAAGRQDTGSQFACQ